MQHPFDDVFFLFNEYNTEIHEYLLVPLRIIGIERERGFFEISIVDFLLMRNNYQLICSILTNSRTNHAYLTKSN